jgi:hypothetical protein
MIFEMPKEGVGMGANLNKTEKSLFVIDKPELKHGAVAIGAPNFTKNIGWNPAINIPQKYRKNNTWLVCPHLSEPNLVYQYYLASGLITIVLGKCFCDACLDMILSRDDLSELIGSGKPMTDSQFQDNFISPLIDSNYNFTKLLGERSDDLAAQKTWITCSHTITQDRLKKLYAAGGQIFIFESFFTCQDCFEKIPTDSLVDLLYAGASMTDALFQENIIDPLYTINYESLAAVGHFRKCKDKPA